MPSARALALACGLSLAAAAPQLAQEPDPGVEADASAAAIEAAGSEPARAPHRLRLARALLALSERDGVSRLEEVRRELVRVSLALPPDLEEADPALVATACQALELLAEVDARLEDPESQRRTQDRLAGLRRQVAATVTRLRDEAEGLRERRELARAIDRLDAALALDPTSGEAFHDRGLCRLKLGEFLAGLLDLSRAMEHQPRVTDAILPKLWQIAYVTDLERVIRETDALVAERPGEACAVFLRGMFRLCKAEWRPSPTPEVLAAAIADFDRVLELNPRHVTALLWRAQMRLRRAALAADPAEREADLAAALTDADRGAALDPPSTLAPVLRAIHWALRAAEPGLSDEEAAARRDRALDELAVARGNGWKPFQPEKERGFDPLREDPRFADLLGQQ